MSSSAVAPPALGAVSPTRLGFCQRCGDPISGKIRCSRCGGTSKEPRIRSTQALPAAKKPDPWAHRYVNADSSFQSAAASGADETDEYLHDRPPPLSPKRASFDPALGFGMPSRISRDLRSAAAMTKSDSASGDLAASINSIPSSSFRLSPVPPELDTRRASQDYSAPLVKGSDGVLSKVCGSLVEPSESRNRWACSDCATVFARDSTLYAAPNSLQKHDSAYYCRDCYAKRYSLGDCRACGRDVLGSTKEDGKYVKASSGIWHGRCWKCVVCQKGGADGVDILVGMDGNPTCEACFDKPRRRAPSAEPAPRKSHHDAVVLDVRRITRVGASRTGPMGATIAELTRKLGQQTVSSPRIPVSTRSGSNTSIPTSSSSNGSLDATRSPAKAQYAFPNHVPTSPGKSAVTRSGSITGSPPKPRPLTAQFRDGLNLAAFKPSFGADDERVRRSDSRSRSVSPVKRPQWTSKQLGSETKSSASNSADSVKVPGSPSLAPVSTASRPEVTPQDPTRRWTSIGFPRPLTSPFSSTEQKEPLQGEKESSVIEPVEGTVRCAACHLLPFERVSGGREVVMVSLADDVHMHAECFRCAKCGEVIDGEKSFVRLADGYAHPQCSPTVQLTVVQVRQRDGEVGERSYRSGLGGGSHATHQRELKPSPIASPAASIGRRTVVDAPALNVRTTPSHPPFSLQTSNPAAGIFTRPTPSTSKYGGMHTCAYCGEKLSSLESTLGPRGTQWHKNCLVCRALVPQPRDVWSSKPDKPCGKRLDSGAKVNAQGEVRCRDCYGRQCSRF